MGFQTVFKRYEIKYMLTQEQKQKVLQAIEPYMALDEYGRTTIRNIYFDTDNCYRCKNKNGCGGCKFLKRYIYTKQKKI